MIIEKNKGEFLFSTDKNKLDIQVIHQYLSTVSYWSRGIPIEVVKSAIEGSFCFAVYHQNAQIAFGRAITDFATFAYLADVFVLETHQGQGVGIWMMECIMEYLHSLKLRRLNLATRDAHTLYEKFGFKALEKPEIYMEKVNFFKYES